MSVTRTSYLEISLEGQALGFYRALDPLEQAVFRAACGAFLGSILTTFAKAGAEIPLASEDVALLRLYIETEQWPRWLDFGFCSVQIAPKKGEFSLICKRVIRAPYI